MGSSTINAVERTLRLIEGLSQNPNGKGIVQLAGETNLPPSTVHRALQTLFKAGYVTQEKASGHYRLTTKLLEVSRQGVVNRTLRQAALAPLSNLRDATHESAHLAILDSGSVVTVESFMSTERNIIECRVGERLPVHCNSVGKCLLAFLGEASLNRVLGEIELTRYTPQTICTLTGLKSELETVRLRGYALDWDEYETGIRCVAAPVRDPFNSVVAAVGISGPSSRITEKVLPNLTTCVVAAADTISQALRGGETDASSKKDA
ncbi:MAG: IclR family transcriptional regulator [Candidatus Hydrogenedentes bacterium]|nr:IclR family transcriptional regulator [Candidatus Hydrogenedentota bacterium]